jgi:L-malate glycosyltransferase
MIAEHPSKGRGRILLLADSPYLGGVSSHIVAIVDAFAGDSRFHFEVASFPGRRDDNTLLELLERRRVPVHVFPMASVFDARVIWHVRRYLEERHIDLVHTHNYRATLIMRCVAGPARVVTTSHGMIVAAPPCLRLWQALALRAMRRHPLTIACSDYVRNWLAERGLSPRRVVTVYNGVQPPLSVTPIPRGALGLGDDALVALFVGRLAPGKGVEELIAALEEARNWALIVVGDGPLRHDLEQQVRECRADVRFLGQAADPWPYYALADVVVLPSHMEAFPMVLIEAASMGKPALTTQTGGIPEAVVHNESGLLVPPGDVAALSEALEALRDPAFRVRLGEGARKRWASRFTLGHMGAALAAAYEQVLGQIGDRDE